MQPCLAGYGLKKTYRSPFGFVRYGQRIGLKTLVGVKKKEGNAGRYFILIIEALNLKIEREIPLNEEVYHENGA